MSIQNHRQNYNLVVGRIILEYILVEGNEDVDWVHLILDKQTHGAGSCESRDESACSIKGETCFYHLNDRPMS
jgi:hypothetical protein